MEAEADVEPAADEETPADASPDETADGEEASEVNAPKIVHFDYYSPEMLPGVRAPVDELDCECPQQSGVTR